MKDNRRAFLSKVGKSLGIAVVMGGVAGSSLHASQNGSSSRDTATSAELSEEQKDELFYIFQEEKVARDVYITLGQIYTNESTFALIQLSEQSHIDSAGALCEKYGVDISYVDVEGVGNFELPVLQTLYDNCISQGENSLPDALRVGELIEITDIADLEHASIGMPDDVVKVYSNLKDGSINHLAAFRSALDRVNG